MALNTSLEHPTEGNVLQNIFLLYQKSVPMEIQMIMVLSHPDAANYTLGLVCEDLLSAPEPSAAFR